MLEKKLEILDKIAIALNAADVMWGVGASLLLWSYGLAENFNDIDLLVAERDVKRADEILCVLGEKLESGPNSAYSTKYFYEYIIDGLEVDLMCEMTVTSEAGSISFSFTEDSVGRRLKIRSADIPFCRLSDWQTLYSYMPGKAAKAEIIVDYLSGDI